MTLYKRTWGSSPSGSFTQTSGVDISGVYGQTVALGVIQTLPVTIDANGLNILNTNSLDFLASQINSGTKGQTLSINYSFNAVPSGTLFTVTDFVCQIVVKVVSNLYPVSAQNISNALVGTVLEYLTTAGPGVFHSLGYIMGTAQTEPEPGTTPTGEITSTIKSWINRPVEYQKLGDTETPFQSAKVTYRGVPVGLQDEDRFSPMNTPAFLPFAQETTDPYNALLLALVCLYARDPEGRRQLTHLAEKYLNTIDSISEALLQQGKTSAITALNASTIWAVFAHRFGLITDSGYLKVMDQTRSLMDKDILMLAAQTGLQSLTEGIKITSKAGLDLAGLRQGKTIP